MSLSVLHSPDSRRRGNYHRLRNLAVTSIDTFALNKPSSSSPPSPPSPLPPPPIATSRATLAGVEQGRRDGNAVADGVEQLLYMCQTCV